MHCAVIGAGIVGLSIGWELARSGYRVTLIDPEPATGATHAAAGMLAAVTEFHYQEQGLLGLSVPAADAWPRWARELEAASGRPTGFEACGTLVVAADGADRADLSALAEAQRTVGLGIGELGTAAAREVEPLLAPRLAGAFRAPGDARTDPRRTAAALLAALELESGVSVNRRRATGVVAGAHGPVVQTLGPDGAREDLEADEVILATGTGRTGERGGAGERISGLPASLRLPVRPVFGDVLRMRPTATAPRPAGSTVRALVSGQRVYILPRRDGEVVVGATEREDDQPGISVEGVHRLLRDALRVMPALAHYELVDLTARARPSTPDHLPLLGRIGPGLLAATGFHRHGVLLSVAAAATIRGLIGPVPGATPPRPPPASLDPTRLAPFDPWRFS
ncbi:MAG: glycine oxidase ThiO [Arthrobacter sp.]|uniref:glycine oxidase ThiO n=1 Tax=unclassified Arthrobacter TaxID=235627 RepID=UPI00264ED55A|nr:glycine oxidase ThiO [Micrococcaceae bacterium]MDN5812618.1 glycine oxidase ThiO [Micrococcaceae bacterium]MDN5824261.1 glycine oxidase ThiO [Micrococcaceae bacterium]MDN5880416.1 glycine oxidase ThiO [Micrococcaceae bacterium]MDN5887213.1 glycine oxidase ThiO [Micrococcaceae bacterium]